MDRARLMTLTIVLGLTTAIEPASVDMSLPAVPAMARGLNADAASVQISLSAFVLGLALGQLFHGPLSDRFGRKPVLLAALGAYVAATLGCAIAPNVDALIGARLAQGIAAAAAQILSRAIVRDRGDREDAARLFSYILLVFAIALVLAPVLGAHIAAWLGWRWVFAFLVVHGSVAAMLIWRRLDETIGERDPAALAPRRLLGGCAEVLGNRMFWGYLACNVFFLCALFAYLAASPAVIITFLGQSPEALGYYIAFTMTGAVIALIVGGWMVRRVGLDMLLGVGVFGGALSVAALAALAWSGQDSVAAIVAPVFFFMAAIALVLPQATAGALSPFAHIAGMASSLLGFLQLASAAVTVALIGYFDDGTQLAMTTAMFAAGVLGLVSYLLLVRRSRPTGA